MARYLQRDDKDNIVSINYFKISDNDIVISDSLYEDFFTLREELSDYYIHDNQLVSKKFNFLETRDELVELKCIDSYDLTIEQLIIVKNKRKDKLRFYFPNSKLLDYKDESFDFSIDDQEFNIKIIDFLDENYNLPKINEYLEITADYKDDSIFKISKKINHVILVNELINITIAKEGKDKPPFEISSKNVNSNKINVIKINGLIKVPVYLRNKIAYYVNRDNRNEIIDIHKSSETLPFIENTLIIIDDYELQAY